MRSPDRNPDKKNLRTAFPVDTVGRTGIARRTEPVGGRPFRSWPAAEFFHGGNRSLPNIIPGTPRSPSVSGGFRQLRLPAGRGIGPEAEPAPEGETEPGSMKKKPSSSERLRSFHAQFSGNDQVLILINADPDAIASAMAVKRLLWRKVAGVAVSNINVIKRPDNVAMVRLLGVSLIHVDEIKDPERYTRVVLVDSQPNHSPAFERFPIHLVIDHHPRTEFEAPFIDIRPAYGATATILTEYIRAAKIKPSARLATGLFHAIKTDTRNFERQTLMEDIRAFQFLFKYANTTLARKIEQADLRLDFLKYFRIALETMKMHRGRVFVHLGTVSNPDVCVLVADFFMRVNPVTWSIVSGVYQDNLVIIFRNDGVRKNAGKLARKGFCQLGSAGGHKSMARAEIPLPALEGRVNLEEYKEVLNWLIGRVERSPGPRAKSKRKENSRDSEKAATLPNRKKR
jgi:nanoRNase/pAp phosphatase (c-di-AMP/oligoRNAs hydrolase)